MRRHERRHHKNILEYDKPRNDENIRDTSEASSDKTDRLSKQKLTLTLEDILRRADQPRLKMGETIIG